MKKHPTLAPLFRFSLLVLLCGALPCAAESREPVAAIFTASSSSTVTRVQDTRLVKSTIARGAGSKLVAVRKEHSLTVDPSARVTSQTFTKAAGNQGIWRGMVEGNGSIHLRLQILKNGSVVTNRYIGSVAMKPRERAAPFTFKGPVPTGDNWSWRILAHAI